MSNQFISPNWHVVLLHYPIAFLTFGILIELFSFFWPRGYFRAAGRWMLLLGGLMSIPTLVVGLYAYRQSVVPGNVHGNWHDIMARSPWTELQRQYMVYHIWLNSIGTLLAVIGVVVWIAGSDLFRRSVSWAVALCFVLAMFLFGIGAWFGGESVYRLGTAVERVAPNAAEMTLAEKVHEHQASISASEEPPEHGLKWYLPPLELHMALAGFAVAFSILALGLTIRRLEKPTIEPLTSDADAPAISTEPVPLTDAGTSNPDDPVSGDPLRDRVVIEQESVGPYGTQLVVVTQPPILFPGRFWVLAFVVLLLTAGAGIWSAAGNFTPQALEHNFNELRDAHAHARLLMHALFGDSLVVLAIILAAVARWGRRKATVTRLFLLLAVVIIAVQVWLGILLLFDSGRGSLFHFNPATTAQSSDPL